MVYIEYGRVVVGTKSPRTKKNAKNTKLDVYDCLP